MEERSAAERVAGCVRECFGRLDQWFQLPVELLQHRPEYDGAWTIAEHLEHLYLANHFLLLTIAKGCRIAVKRAAGAEIPAGESELESLEAVAIPGMFEWTPPTHMIPTGKAELAELRNGLERQRGKCLELLSAMPRGEGRLYSIRMSVNRLGRLDMYQWMYFLAQHVRYHLNFIETRKPTAKPVSHGDTENTENT